MLSYPWNKGKKGVQISWFKGKKMSEEQKLKVSLNRRGKCIGEGHHNWQGGKTKASTKIRNSSQYKDWRNIIFKRDNYKCLECGARSKTGNPIIIHADHIKPFAYFPELRFDIDNGRTLCIDCHKKTDTYLSKAKKIIYT